MIYLFFAMLILTTPTHYQVKFSTNLNSRLFVIYNFYFIVVLSSLSFYSTYFHLHIHQFSLLLTWSKQNWQFSETWRNRLEIVSALFHEESFLVSDFLHPLNFWVNLCMIIIICIICFIFLFLYGIFKTFIPFRG